MKQIIIQIPQWLTLLLSWIIISPLFVYLANKWKLIGKKVRILLLLISPLMLIVYFIIFLLALQGYFDYQRKYRFADNEVIERITGVALPEVPKFIVDPNIKEVPNGFVHIKESATKGVDKLIDELRKL